MKKIKDGFTNAIHRSVNVAQVHFKLLDKESTLEEVIEKVNKLCFVLNTFEITLIEGKNINIKEVKDFMGDEVVLTTSLVKNRIE
jgi:2C-methyl-D-erythritol 2,4-cyclodiphosphate synthase